MLMPTANPHADAEAWADQVERQAVATACAQGRIARSVRIEVIEAIKTCIAATKVTHVTISGKPTAVALSEVMSETIWDQDDAILRLLVAASNRDTHAASAIASDLMHLMATRHGESVAERLDIDGGTL
jgi:hypothetical protein